MNPSPMLSAVQVPSLLGAVDPGTVVPIVFAIFFIIWIVYTVVAAYHWFRYGHRFSLAIPALMVHVVMSFGITLFAVSGLHA